MRTDNWSIHLLTVNPEGSTLANFDAYGYAKKQILYFKSNRVEHITSHHALGHGHRMYHSELKRFFQPDRHSPFNRGGLNVYAYCLGDPVNRYDQTGQASIFSLMRKQLARIFGQSKGGVQQIYHDKGIKNLLTLPRNPMPRVPQRSLHNRYPLDLLSEISEFEKHSLYQRVLHSGSAKLLSQVKPGKDYKYVVNNHGELILSRWTRSSDGNSIIPSHAALALQFRSGSKVVAAGHLNVRSANHFIINNLSGHYRPARRTVNWPAFWLSTQGGVVEMDYVRSSLGAIS